MSSAFDDLRAWRDAEPGRRGWDLADDGDEFVARVGERGGLIVEARSTDLDRAIRDALDGVGRVPTTTPEEGQ